MTQPAPERARCLYCRRLLPETATKSRGVPRKWCSGRCKDRAYDAAHKVQRADRARERARQRRAQVANRLAALDATVLKLIPHIEKGTQP